MKIVFIGSGHGVPEPNRKCSCIYLETQGHRYLIDAGADPTEELIRRGISPDTIESVFITHMHSDHLNGLIPLISLCSWFYKNVKLHVAMPDLRAVPVFRSLLEVEGEKLWEGISFSEVKEGLIFEDGTIRVTAFRTGHIDRSFAFLIEAEGKKLLFTGDMKHGTGPVDDYGRFAARDDLDLAVAECAHFNAMLYEEPLLKHTPKRFCLNHYSWAYVESCYHLMETLKDKVDILPATDGLELEI